MRILLIVNILLCVFVLLIVPALIVPNGPLPAEVINYIVENSLENEEQTQFLDIIYKTTDFQREKLSHKIILPQVACGIILCVNLYLIIRHRKWVSPKMDID